jgi:hypothetical protein
MALNMSDPWSLAKFKCGHEDQCLAMVGFCMLKCDSPGSDMLTLTFKGPLGWPQAVDTAEQPSPPGYAQRSGSSEDAWAMVAGQWAPNLVVQHLDHLEAADTVALARPETGAGCSSLEELLVPVGHVLHLAYVRAPGRWVRVRHDLGEDRGGEVH